MVIFLATLQSEIDILKRHSHGGGKLLFSSVWPELVSQFVVRLPARPEGARHKSPAGGPEKKRSGFSWTVLRSYPFAE